MVYILTVNNNWSIEDYKEMINEGVSAFRINAVHATDDTLLRLKKVKSMFQNRVTFYVDLPGRKTRIWSKNKSREQISAGEIFRVSFKESDARFWISNCEILNDIEADAKLIVRRVKRNNFELRIVSIDKEGMLLEALNDGIIGYGYHIYSADIYKPNSDLSQDDIEQWKRVKGLNPEIVALSFVDESSVVEQFKADYALPEEKIYAKIESRYAVEHIVQIANRADGLIIGRDDLGAFFQKNEIENIIEYIAKIANDKYIPMICASNYFQNIYDMFKLTDEDYDDFKRAYSNKAQAIYINETNKDVDWRKYLLVSKQLETINL